MLELQHYNTNVQLRLRELLKRSINSFLSNIFMSSSDQLIIVSQKKYTKLMTITLSILNGFSKFFHCWKEKYIFNITKSI